MHCNFYNLFYFIFNFALVFFSLCILFYFIILFNCMTVLCEALWVCFVYEKCYINKVALPCAHEPMSELSATYSANYF